MSDFKKFKKQFRDHFDSIIDQKGRLFLTSVTKEDLWDTYLNSFPEGTNPIFKERREYDCNCCKSFIRSFGSIVTIQNNELVSIWDIPGAVYPFDVVSKKLSELVKSAPIRDVFVSQENDLGVDQTHSHDLSEVITWEHFHYRLPVTYIDKTTKSIGSIQGTHRDFKNVFKRSMEELTEESGKIILELIAQKSLYRGEEYGGIIELFLEYKNQYKEIPEEGKDIWCWEKSHKNPVSKIRNTAIGTLLIDLSEGLDLDIAVTKFEKVMAPENYKRPKAIFTKRMIEEAEKKLNELGFAESLERRFAQLEDITVNNILFVNRDAKKRLKKSVFDELKEETKQDLKRFDKVDEVSIDDFLEKILPETTNLELLLEGKHEKNLLSLIAPVNQEAKTMFKWNNNFSWAYNGDIADSDIKKNVKNAGGNVEGILRFSIQWNHGNQYNGNDFDAHCHEPNGNHIFFSNKGRVHTSSGMLDVDIINPIRNTPAVENITWTDEKKMPEGVYQFLVHNYSHNGGREGFSAEIEFNGEIYSFDYPKELKHNEKVVVAEIKYSRKDGIKFLKSLDSTRMSKELWGIKTHQFVKVNVCMFSPNYWDGQESNGNRHYFFFMDDCKNETNPRGFFNEFLNEGLKDHRKVFEALGSKMRVEESTNQLSGIGFSSTQRNSILAKVDGSFSRVIKINF